MSDYEKSIETFDRRLLVLGMFKGQESLTAKMICDRLGYTGDEITERSVQRGLEMLVTGDYLEIANPGSRPHKFRATKKAKSLNLSRMPDQEVLALRLLEQFLAPMLPPGFYKALQPYFEKAQHTLKAMSSFASLKNWETKVHVLPPAQPLLPPQPPPALMATLTVDEWEDQQAAVRDTILQALFENRQCQVEYQQMWRDAPADWTLHPLIYLQRGPAFYLLCTINEFSDVRQLALHRIRSARLLDAKAQRPSGFNPDQEVERSQGMGGNHEPIRLVTRFWRKAGSHLLETRLSADQVVEDDEESDFHFWLTATVNDTAQLRWWLLSFGQHVEVFEPEGLRAELANHAYWMHRRYSRPKEPPTTQAAPAPEAGGTEGTRTAESGAS